MERLNDIITVLAVILGVAAYFNAEKLRKRLNNIQDALIKKDIVKLQDIIPDLRDDK